MSFGQRYGLVADEERSEEVKSQRKPKNPFVVFEAQVFLLLPSMFMQ